MDNILDMKLGQLSVIIGTIFKEQKKKPNVFTNITGPIDTINAVSCSTCTGDFSHGKFTSDDDQAILEDASGRINIRENPTFRCNQFVTGSIVALLGVVDAHGFFICQDFCHAGVPFRAELPSHINCNKTHATWRQNLSNRKFVAFVSGLNFGSLSEQAPCKRSLTSLAKFMQGDHLDPDLNLLSSRVQRLVICGDSIREDAQSNKV